MKVQLIKPCTILIELKEHLTETETEISIEMKYTVYQLGLTVQ
jgi:hypothetical protein